MADREHLRAQHEALTHEGGSSADRARLWAGLNRFLAAEAEHEQKVADAEHEADETPTDDERG